MCDAKFLRECSGTLTLTLTCALLKGFLRETRSTSSLSPVLSGLRRAFESMGENFRIFIFCKIWRLSCYLAIGDSRYELDLHDLGSGSNAYWNEEVVWKMCDRRTECGTECAQISLREEPWNAPT